MWINGVHKDTPRRLIGEFPAVLFSPATLSIVQDGPGERRKFIDIAISLVKPNYAGILSKYIKTLSERNALLRQAAASGNISSDMFFHGTHSCPRSEQKYFATALNILK